ncbi:MAG: hypothetical protein AAGA99_23500 [Actinomycetota bacterium]
MHPIERLRYVARAGGADQASLVSETASSLAALGVDDAGLVTACRRVVQRHPTAGALWTMCARALTSVDGMAAAYEVARDVNADSSPITLVDALPEDGTVLLVGWTDLAPSSLPRRGDLEVFVVDADGAAGSLCARLQANDVDAVEIPLTGLGAAAAEADVVVVDAEFAGPTGAVAPSVSRAAAAVARSVDAQVWLLAGEARVLPGRVWDAALARVHQDEPWYADLELVPIDLIDRVVRPAGTTESSTLALEPDGPVAPELLTALSW